MRIIGGDAMKSFFRIISQIFRKFFGIFLFFFNLFYLFPLKIFFLLIGIVVFLIGLYVGNEEMEKRPQGADQVALLKGIALLEEVQHDQSIAFFNEALEINPRNADAYFNRGLAYGNKGRHDKAIADFTKTIKINPNYTEAYNSRGHVNRSKYDNFDGAIADYTMAIEINPKFAEAYHNRGLAYYHKGQYDKSCSDWRRACELGSCEIYEFAKDRGYCE
jgi:tetratricopeptide (TPR) repeat protein